MPPPLLCHDRLEDTWTVPRAPSALSPLIVRGSPSEPDEREVVNVDQAQAATDS